jgi:hypothetical protein
VRENKQGEKKMTRIIPFTNRSDSVDRGTKLSPQELLTVLAKRKARGEEIHPSEFSRFKSSVKKFLKMPVEDILRQRSLVLMKRSPLSVRERDLVFTIGNIIYTEQCALAEKSFEKEKAKKREEK